MVSTGKKARGKHRLDKYYHLAKEQGCAPALAIAELGPPLCNGCSSRRIYLPGHEACLFSSWVYGQSSAAVLPIVREPLQHTRTVSCRL